MVSASLVQADVPQSYKVFNTNREICAVTSEDIYLYLYSITLKGIFHVWYEEEE